MNTLVNYLSLIASINMIVIGFITIYNLLDRNCSNDCLNWDDNFSTNDINSNFRSIFSLSPSFFLKNFTPLIFGFISFLLNFDYFNKYSLTTTWLKNSLWFLFLSIFCNFGYSGNYGILNGFFCSFISLLSIILFFLNNNESTTLSIKTKIVCNGLKNKTFIKYITMIIKILSLCTAILLIIIGFIHAFINELSKWCDGSSCVGPLLNWNDDFNDFIKDSNFELYGNYFVLDPNLFFNIFGPLFFGILTLLSHFEIYEKYNYQNNFFNSFIYNLFLSLFTSMGYA